VKQVYLARFARPTPLVRENGS